MKQKDIVVFDLSDFPKPNMSEKDKPNYYKPVNEYTLEGVYIKTWKSPAVARRAYKMPHGYINQCCRGNILYIKKYGKIFLYKGDDINKRLKDIQQSNNNSKAPHFNIKVYNKRGRLLSTYPSLGKASDKYHISPRMIRNCCSGNRLIIKDYIFLFETGDIKERLHLIKQKEEFDAAIEKEILKEG